MKTVVILTLVGALAGIAIAAWIVPPALSWYTEPGGLPNGNHVQSLVVVPDVIHYATSRLIHPAIGIERGLQHLGAVISDRAIELPRRDRRVNSKRREFGPFLREERLGCRRPT